jgi:hypothetical protein
LEELVLSSRKRIKKLSSAKFFNTFLDLARAKNGSEAKGSFYLLKLETKKSLTVALRLRPKKDNQKGLKNFTVFYKKLISLELSSCPRQYLFSKVTAFSL